MFPRLPNDFTSEALAVFEKEQAEPGHVLIHLSECGIAPGERVYADPDGSFSGGRRNAVVLGYTKPRGYAKVLTREGELLLVSPEALTRKCARWQCQNEATSGPNVHSHNWRYCRACQRRINTAAGAILVPNA